LNKRFIAVLAFAFIVATGASVLLYRLMTNRPPVAAAAAPQPPRVKILLAARNLEVGALIKETDIRLADWPGAVPPGAVAKKEDLIARGVTAPIFANEPVLESRVAPKGAGGGMAAMIPRGMRAVALRVNEVIGLAGFAVAGMRVDVLISGNPPGGGGSLGTLTKTLLQNIEVLSAGQEFRKDTEGKPITVQVVNLLVTPEDAEKLSLANAQTTIQLVLRNPLDQDRTSTPGAALSTLFSGAAMKRGVEESRSQGVKESGSRKVAAPAPAPPPVRPAAVETPKPPFVMEIIQGARKTESRFGGAPEAKP
jgi:pilus assembly protein CpaB